MKPKTRLLLILSILAIASNLNFGFSTTYMNLPIDYFQNYIKESLPAENGQEPSKTVQQIVWNSLQHCFFIGAFIGIVLNPIFNEKCGRKKTLVTFAFVGFLSSILRVFAINFKFIPLFYVARIVGAVSCTIVSQTQLLFLQECSPTKFRGSTSFLGGFWFAMMAFISIILGLDFVLGKHVNILVIGAAVANFFAFLIILPFHETPKYLYISRVDKKSTIESIEFYLGNEFNSNDYFVEIEQEALLIAGRKKTVKEFLTERPTRQAAILSILALQNTTPYWSILLASTFFFQKAGISKEISQISTASTIFVYFVGTIVGMFWIQKFKRRTFIICFTAFNISTLAFYTIFDFFSPKLDFLKYGCLVCLAVYGFTFGAGAGPVNQIVGVELVTQKDKSLLQAVSQTGNQFAVIIITGALMPLFELIRSITFIILFVIPSTISLVYLYFKMPETRDRSLNEITKDLE